MNHTEERPSIEIYTDGFMESLSKLPQNTKSKAIESIIKFQRNPYTKGLNLEHIDRNFYTIRIDKPYRIVLYHQPEENLYIAVWAANHDSAYDWIETHEYAKNKFTGRFQLTPVLVKQTAFPPSVLHPQKVVDSLFEKFSDKQLVSIGIPERLLGIVRKITSREDLIAIQPALPVDAYQALVFLADGGKIEKVPALYSNTITSTRIGETLANGNIKVPDSDEELEKILSASVAKWRVFLHPTQQKIVTNPKTYPMMVRGSAGTGKTVVAMHRAMELVRRLDWDPEKKLLFTTFTTNLAEDIKQQLKTICNDEELARIEVKNIDKWVVDYLKQFDSMKDWRVIFPNSEAEEKLWNKTLRNHNTSPRFDAEFLKDEWQGVVLPNKIDSIAKYLRASRKGRGKSISLSDRKMIWPVFQDMLNQMTAQNLISSYEACEIAADILKNDEKVYDAVIVDEAQDMGAEALKLLAVLATVEPGTEPRIFLVGDGQQRIYSRKAVLSECGINVIGRRSSRLTITYRTTEQIKLCAEAVLKGVEFEDLDGQRETLVGSVAKRSGVVPEVKEFKDMFSEVDWVTKKIRALTMDGNGTKYSDICVVTRTNNRLKGEYKRLLEERGYNPVIISNSRVDDSSKNEIRLATMHRVKGLEFKVVFIVGADEGFIPLARAIRSNDPMLAKRKELQERALFYVATSRARDALFISSPSPAGEYMKMLKKCADSLNKSKKKFAKV